MTALLSDADVKLIIFDQGTQTLVELPDGETPLHELAEAGLIVVCKTETPRQF